MKLKFKDQDFQTAAVEAVAGLFAGQERSRATFSVMDEGQLQIGRASCRERVSSPV